MLLFSDFDDFPALVIATALASPVRQFRLVAVGTLGNAGTLQGIVGPALPRPGRGMSPFRIRHDLSFNCAAARRAYFRFFNAAHRSSAAFNSQ
jgi:hypothetical protein